MQPTMKLRWYVERTDIPYAGIKLLDKAARLQQWFEDGNGSGEWRDVPIERE